MAYDKETVRQMLIRQFGGAQNLANSVGQSEGGSTQSQHESALQFWQYALELLDEPDNGILFDRAFAENEIARHRAALAALTPHQSTRSPFGGGPV
jgi:hypothetical protein